MKIQSIVIILLLFMQVVTPVMAASPIQNNIMGDIALYGKIQAEGNTGTMDIKLNNGKIHISDKVHGKKNVKMYLSALDYVDGFDGDKFTVTHKNDAGIIDGSDIITLTTQDKARGFITMDMVFSENIIGGFTGSKTLSGSGINGNLTLDLGAEYNYSYLNFTLSRIDSVCGGSEFDRYSNVTIGSLGTLKTDFNILLNVSYDADMQSDFDDICFEDLSGVKIPHFKLNLTNGVNASIDIRTDLPASGGATISMFYGNATVSDMSDGNNTYPLFDHFTEGSLNATKWDNNGAPPTPAGSEIRITQGVGTTQNIMSVDSFAAGEYEMRARVKLDTGQNQRLSLGFQSSIGSTGINYPNLYASSIDRLYSYYSTQYTSYDFSTGVWYNPVVQMSSDYKHTISVGSASSTSTTALTANDNHAWLGGNYVDAHIDWVAVRNYTAIAPSVVFGAEVVPSTNATITTTIIGDSNVTNLTTQSGFFTLMPTANISNVTFVTNVTNWAYTVDAYWTEDTTRVTETNTGGVYQQIVEYTPVNDVTDGYINTTINSAIMNYSLQEYISSKMAFQNGSNVSADLASTTNETFNLSVSGLTGGGAYNFTFQYYLNNAPTVGTIANQSCTKGLSCTIPHPTYNDPEGLGHTDFWDYGDGHNGTDGIHTYEASGTYNLSLNITEVATISPQTIIRNATITATGFNLTITVRDIDSTVLINNYTATHESTNIVTTNGTATFTDLTYGPTSVLVASTGYYASAGSIELTQNDSLIVYLSNEGGDYYAPHYVKFRLRSILWHKYTNIDTVVYYAGTAIHTGETDNDGSIGFMLSEDKQYRVTFINATQGISEEVTIYPVDVQYTVIIGFTGIIPDDRPDDDILYGTAKSSINLTTGYVNATFNDTSGTTTLAEFWVNNTNGTNVYYTNTTNSTETFSALVAGGNATYMTRFKITNTVMSDPLEVVRSVKFNDVVRYSLGLDEGWKYQLIAIVFIFFVGLLGSALNADKMAVIVVLAGWWFLFLGWLTAGASVGGEIGAGMMLMLATLLAFGNVVRKGDVG